MKNMFNVCEAQRASRLHYTKLMFFLMKPQNDDFNSYIYILCYQSNIHYYSTDN